MTDDEHRFQKEVMHSLGHMQGQMTGILTEIRQMREDHKEDKVELSEQKARLEQRVSALERTKNMMMGGIALITGTGTAVITWIVQHMAGK